VRTGFFAFILAAMSFVASSALAQTLTLYSGKNFSGESRQVTLVNTNVGGFVARSADSSSGKWRVCSGPLGLLGCTTVEGRVAELGGSNGISVVSVVFGGAATGGQTNNPNNQNNQNTGQQPVPPQSGVLLFSGPNYTGRQVAIFTDTSNLDSMNMGDSAQSAMVAYGESWSLCDNSNYGGSCMQLSGSMASLASLNSRGSSLRRSTVYGGGQTQYPQTQNPQTQYPQNTYPNQQTSYGAANGRTATFFPQPLFNNRPMLACPDNPSKPSASCARKSAEQFCRLSGFAKLGYYTYNSAGSLEDVLCTK
jgi:hypothetical protein